MVEDYDALGRRVPWEIEGGPRRWAIAVGRAAEEILSQRHGSKPSRESVKMYVEKVKGTPEGMRLLNRQASLRILEEFENEVGGFVRGGMGVSAARKRANQVIRERYEQIEEDSQRNFAFLDPILFPRGTEES